MLHSPQPAKGARVRPCRTGSDLPIATLCLMNTILKSDSLLKPCWRSCV